MSTNRPSQGFGIVILIAMLLIVPAGITLRTVREPGVLAIASDNPTPLGYTISLLLFVVPIGALGAWFTMRPD